MRRRRRKSPADDLPMLVAVGIGALGALWLVAYLTEPQAPQVTVVPPNEPSRLQLKGIAT
jgi:hypothetical protein